MLRFIDSTYRVSLLDVAIVLTLLLCCAKAVLPAKLPTSDPPVVNRAFPFEPALFARIRWGINSRSILNKAYKKYKGHVYRVARGDVDLVVVPLESIPELNRLPDSILSSRTAHSHNLLGHLNGINVVLKSGVYFKTIVKKLTPALPKLTGPLQQCLGAEIKAGMPTELDVWKTVRPLPIMARCVGRAFSLISVGAPLCHDIEHIRLVTEQTRLVFGIVLVLRFVPTLLQPILVWLHPFKWRLEANMKQFESLIVPEVTRLRNQIDLSGENNLLYWVLQSSRSEPEIDPVTLSQLHAATASGSIHSVSLLVCNVLFDLAANTELYDEICDEIRAMNKKYNGIWNYTAYGNLRRLDSVMKESGRVGPMTMPVYNRQLLADYTMNNGVTLRKGQMICVSGCSVQQDSEIFTNADSYQGLRAYDQNMKDGTNNLFRKVDNQLFWGSGRLACPGRYLADLQAKIVIVKLLVEYDIKSPPGRTHRKKIVVHDYGFINENEPLMIRRRANSNEVGY